MAAPYVYIHFIEGPAPAKLELPKSHGDVVHLRAPRRDRRPPRRRSLDGTWNVGTGSLAGYRVQEVLLGQNATAVGPHEQDLGLPDDRRLDA